MKRGDVINRVPNRCDECGADVIVALTRSGQGYRMQPAPVAGGEARLLSQEPWSPTVQFGTAIEGEPRYDRHRCPSESGS